MIIPLFFSERLPNKGGLTQLVQETIAREGIPTKVEFSSWHRATDMVKHGYAAGSPGWSETEARKKDFLFSEPFYVAHDAVFFLRKALCWPPNTSNSQTNMAERHHASDVDAVPEQWWFIDGE